MMSGISMRSLAIDSRRALSSVRSGDPGAYDFTGSFTGVGTRRTPVNEDCSLTWVDEEALCAGAGALASEGRRLVRAEVERVEGFVGAAMAGWIGVAKRYFRDMSHESCSSIVTSQHE